MTPSQTAARYDRIAEWWGQQHAASGYGIAQLKRAISFVPKKGRALDVGCGSSGRFIGTLVDHGFETDGMDVSPQMISLARRIHPDCEYHIADIATWKLPRRYDLISAWDSTFHLPLDLQEPALRTMCEGLNPGGVLIFTCGGKDKVSSISGEFQGENFEYSSLGLNSYLQLIAEFGCVCRHLEYDQGSVETHVYIIAQKIPHD